MSRPGGSTVICGGLSGDEGIYVARRTILSVSFDATIDRVHGGYSSAAERLTVAQDVEGSIPSSRPKKSPEKPNDGNR